ncbi:MAG: rhamnulokinase [Bacteroidaceae bacterium]|nr:rhamnulokinase [Bacteroidaceae bacterium]
MEKQIFLAFDLGATSGRAVTVTLCGNKFDIEEIHRFPNGIMQLEGKYYWNVYSLYEELKKALRICVLRNIKPHSIGIDTWGVDFGYIAKDGSLMNLPRAYRDPYTDGAPEEYFNIVPRKELYASTGIQIMNFNSLFQLFSAKKEGSTALEEAKHILFMPDLLTYLLTGKMVCEYTEASTSQILNPAKKEFEKQLLDAAGINSDILLPLSLPGTLVGTLSDSVAEETGIGKIPVYAVAGHDTASAIAAIPSLDKEYAYLSSGTWSLMGIECENPIINEESYRHNFTNEGGIDGTTCFLKNITGMWLLEQCRKEWERESVSYSYPQIVELATDAEPFRCFIQPDAPEFANPASMSAAIVRFCEETGQPAPQTHAQFIRCIFESLALCYRHTLETMRSLSPHEIIRLHIIGGGSKNTLLNQLTANALGIPTVAGPAEATAIGNCMVQARAAGLVGDRWEMRRMIAQMEPPVTFEPQDSEQWQQAYERYKTIINLK